MHNPRLLVILIGCLLLCHVVARPKVQKSGHNGINDSRPFRLIRPWFACNARSTPYPKMIKSMAMYRVDSIQVISHRGVLFVDEWFVVFCSKIRDTRANQV